MKNFEVFTIGLGVIGLGVIGLLSTPVNPALGCHWVGKTILCPDEVSERGSGRLFAKFTPQPNPEPTSGGGGTGTR